MQSLQQIQFYSILIKDEGSSSSGELNQSLAKIRVKKATKSGKWEGKKRNPNKPVIGQGGISLTVLTVV